MKQMSASAHTRVLLVALALVASVGAVLAQAKDVLTSPIAQACKADFVKHCALVKPGDGRVVDCLRQHETDLSPACKSQLGIMSDCSQQVKKICGSDLSDLNAVRACVKSRAGEFSASCLGAMPVR